jgi:hypothetical protein
MKSWKTTASGVLAIALAVLGYADAYLKSGALGDPTAVVAAVIAGVGLIMAKDASAK